MARVSVPANFSAAADGQSAFNVSWDAVPNASGYTVEWSTSSDFATSTTATVTGTSHRITGLTVGTEYHIRIKTSRTGLPDSRYATDSATTESPQANRAPSFHVTSSLFSIDENSTAGTAVGTPITATDPDAGDTLRYSLSGTGAGQFTVSAAGQITVAAGANLDRETTPVYLLTLTVTDSGGLTATTQVSITIRNVNEPPSFAQTTYPRSVAENATTGANVGSPIVATDPDARDILSYSLSGTNSGSFAVSSTGQITVSAAGLASGVPGYTLTLTFRDSGGLTDTATVNITVTATNDPPRFSVSSYTLTVLENSTAGTNVGAPITATDPDGDALAYSLSGTGSGNFAVSSTGQITVATGAVLNREARSLYTLTLTAEDPGGLRATTGVLIGIGNVNEAPSFSETSYARAVNENSVAGTTVGAAITATDPDVGDTLSYSLSGTGSGNFTVSSAGQISVASGARLDHETTDSYSITLTARDAGGLTATTLVIITIGDVPEDPVFANTSYSRSVDENSTTGTNVGNPITAADPNGDTLTYGLSGTGSGLFSVSSVGQITVAGDLDHEATDSYSLTITARDPGGNTGSATVAVAVRDVNEAPAFAESAYSRSVDENSGAGTNVGQAVVATDVDDGDTLTYSLSGTGASLFAVSNAGQITVAAGASLDMRPPPATR